jgi:peroxiredoxin
LIGELMMKATSGLLMTICAAAGALALATASTAPAGEEIEKATLGEPAPDFTLLDTKGQKKTLSGYKGKLVVLEWINPSCPYVVKCYKTKAMQEAYEQVKALDKGIVWLAINTTYNTSREENQVWIDKFELKYPILLDTDGEVGRLYDARRTPHMFVIDKEGVLRYHGAIDNNPFSSKPAEEVTNYVVDAVRQIVEGETVAPDYMKPYGCTVKYNPKKRR